MKKLKVLTYVLTLTLFALFNVAAINIVELQKDNEVARLDTPKEAMCGAIGCAGGERVCATASGTITVEVPPYGSIEVNVTYQCYEHEPVPGVSG